ncbi:hypothetical protein [Parapedobacter sp. 2B3]|uniref:hypothetical protein n=1 Tax=Parapedobacter sp. 2B3 TaxID=3342381 RepID=UPI0035B62F70
MSVTLAEEGDDKMVIKPAHTKVWIAFPLNEVRLLPGSPFYQAVQIPEVFPVIASTEE